MIAQLVRVQFLERVALSFLAVSTASFATNCIKSPASAFSAGMDTQPDYAAWDAVLKKHVKPTNIRGIPVNSVDYQGIRNDPNFTAFVNSIAAAPSSGLGRNAEYALWINSYNALAIKMVIDHPCKTKFLGLKKSSISSIRDIGTLVAPVWKKTAGVVGGQSLSLDDIENDRLRAPKDYEADPLLHACIVCASVSCPDVALKAYKPETLKADMEANMKLFLTNTKKGLALDKSAGSIKLSKVFQWFAEDFIKAGNASVLDALLPYMPEDAKAYVAERKNDLKIEHFEYDWGLNGPAPGAATKDGRC